MAARRQACGLCRRLRELREVICSTTSMKEVERASRSSERLYTSSPVTYFLQSRLHFLNFPQSTTNWGPSAHIPENVENLIHTPMLNNSKRASFIPDHVSTTLSYH